MRGVLGNSVVWASRGCGCTARGSGDREIRTWSGGTTQQIEAGV